MNIAILTIGTQGDVQPFVALGIGLEAAGHKVTLATGKGFEAFVSEHGLRYDALDVDLLEFLQTPEGKTALAGKNLPGTMKKVMSMMRRVLDEEWMMAREADAIVYHPKALGGYHIAERLRVPAFVAHPIPLLSPTRAFPNPILPFANLGGFLNKLSYRMFLCSISAPYHRTINRWRRETLGLPPRPFLTSELVLHGRPVRRLYCCSPHIVPAPDDWDDSTAVTGYWFLNRKEGWQPPEDLSAFLASGASPVYVGFGSLAGWSRKNVLATAIAALKKAGQRGVLVTGRHGISPANLSHGVCLIESAPHEWLFPRVRAVVHHGGAGTTAEGLRAGKPTVVCSLFGDQPFWGRRVAALGAGPQPIPQRKLTVDRLTRAIRLAVTDEDMRHRTTGIGEKIRAEHGVDRAVGIINDALM